MATVYLEHDLRHDRKVALKTGKLDIWIKELDRGPFTRLTFGGRTRGHIPGLLAQPNRDRS